jgi:hypothetical protein
MIQKTVKNKIIISLVMAIFLSPAMAESSSGIGSGKEIKHTAKITFFRNMAGNLMAEIIPVDTEGYSPRTGWTICEMMSSDIQNIYSERIKNVKRVKGYFWVTYKIIEKDPESIFLRYKGELIKIEPWVPPFTKNRKRNF